MVLIGGSGVVVLYLCFGLTGAESLLAGLALLTALAVYTRWWRGCASGRK
jgi:hypothetical protein